MDNGDLFSQAALALAGDQLAEGYPAAGLEVRVFEEDHPASQEAKRSALAVAGIPVPGNVTFVPADLAAGSLVRCLAAPGGACRPLPRRGDR